MVSGDEAASDPNVRAMAERAEKVLAIGMFRRLVTPWADLILPGTSYLERDGTYINLEGRLQRLRRTAIPPAPDELAVIARLAQRFDVELSPHPALVFDELSAICYGGIPFGDVGEQASLRPRVPSSAVPVPGTGTRPERQGGRACGSSRTARSSPGPRSNGCRSCSSSGPEAEVELARDDAKRLGIAEGQTVNVRSNGTTLELRARLSRELSPGVARIPVEHAAGLEGRVEVAP